MNPVDIPPVPPVEIQAPDISRWREGNTGVPFVHLIDSGLPGPRVHVQALTHGNEICGAIAVDELLREGFQPRIGQLCVVFANHEAYARWDPQDPYSSRYVDEDINRVWSDAALAVGETVEKRRARELQPFLDEADFILDIHSMNEDCVPLMVCNHHGFQFRKPLLEIDDDLGKLERIGLLRRRFDLRGNLTNMLCELLNLTDRWDHHQAIVLVTEQSLCCGNSLIELLLVLDYASL